MVSSIFIVPWRHRERGKKTRQTKEKVGGQHQGMDRHVCCTQWYASKENRRILDICGLCKRVQYCSEKYTQVTVLAPELRMKTRISILEQKPSKVCCFHVTNMYQETCHSRIDVFWKYSFPNKSEFLKTIFLTFLFKSLLTTVLPNGISPMGNSGCSSQVKPVATESRYPTYSAYWVF